MKYKNIDIHNVACLVESEDGGVSWLRFPQEVASEFEGGEGAYNVARYAISAKLRKTPISAICKELVEISYYSLKTQLEEEEKFLEPIMELLKKGKTPCDMF